MSNAHRLFRVAAMAGVLAAALAWTVVGRAGAVGGPPPTATPACSGAQLQLKLVDFQGALGGRFWDFAFKNTGRTCKVSGYPRAVLLGRRGHSVGAHVRHEPGMTPKNVIVAHGKRAFFTFHYEDGGFCPHKAFHAFGFRFFAPLTNHGTTFNPVPKNGGTPPSICKGSEKMFPVRATKAVQ